MYSQPVGRVTEVLGEIDDPGMEIEIAVRKYEVPHVFSDADAGAGGDAARRGARRRPQGPRRPDRRAARHHRRRGRARLRRRRLLRAGARSAASRRDNGWRLIVAIADVSHYVQAGRAARRRCLRARDLGVLPAPRDSDAAGEAVERPVLAESGGRPAVRWSATCSSTRDGEVKAYQFYPGRDPLGRAPHLHRSRRHPRQHARPGGGRAQPSWCRIC